MLQFVDPCLQVHQTFFIRFTVEDFLHPCFPNLHLCTHTFSVYSTKLRYTHYLFKNTQKTATFLFYIRSRCVHNILKKNIYRGRLHISIWVYVTKVARASDSDAYQSVLKQLLTSNLLHYAWTWLLTETGLPGALFIGDTGGKLLPRCKSNQLKTSCDTFPKHSCYVLIW